MDTGGISLMLSIFQFAQTIRWMRKEFAGNHSKFAAVLFCSWFIPEWVQQKTGP